MSLIGRIIAGEPQGDDNLRSYREICKLHDLLVFQHQPTQFDAPLFRALGRLGVDAHVVFDVGTPGRDPELGLSPEFGDIASGYSWSIRTRASLRTYLGRHVVISGWDKPSNIGLLASARSRRVSCGVRFDSVLREAGSVARSAERVRRTRAGTALGMASVWHPVGSQSLRFAESFPFRPQAVLLLPYAADVCQFTPQGREAGTEGVLRVLAVAKLVERENVECVIRAVALVPRARLTVVGDGPDSRRLRSVAASIGARVDFLGYKPYSALPELYSRVDIFVHAPYVEVWGVSVQEAMASGLPVLVSTGVGSATDLLDPTQEDVWFHPDDVQKLAQLLEYYRDPALRGPLGEANRISALRLTPERTARRLVEFLEKLQ